MSDTKYKSLEKYTTPVKRAERAIIGREKEMNQLRATFSRPELCNAILLGEAGSGKALDDNTLIPVNDERCYVKIKDLKIGDYVFNEKGEPVEVLGVFPQGVINAYKVTQKDGDSLICNDEHIFGAVNYAGYSRYDKPSEHTVREMLDTGGKWFIPVSDGVFRTYYEDDNFDDYYFTGILFAGLVSDNHFMVSRESANYVSQTIKVKPDICEDGSYFYNGFDFNLSQLIDNKFFEEVIINTSYFCRKMFARGVIDGVGKLNQKKNMLVLECHNKELVTNLRELFSSIGFRLFAKNVDDYVLLSIKSPVYKLKDFYNLNKKLDDYFFNRGETVSSILNTLPRSDYIEIFIEPMNEKRSMTCIYVEGESHLFVAGKEYIVTHNTALIQGLMTDDKDRMYREVSLSKMIADVGDNPDKIADMLKTLFDEVSAYSKDEEHEIVLFIDEFHQVVQLSAAAVEVLKPLLADSGTRGIKVAAATTYEEFRQYISPNQPLVERLQRINLVQPSEEVTVSILRGMAERYKVDGHIKGDSLFHQIYEYTNRYIPASSQPRKSIILFDTMIGWHKAFGKKIDFKLLADVIYQTQGVNVSFAVDGRTIKERLDKKVFAQGVASTEIEKRLQICVADLNNKSKPQATLLFTGSTGVGKQVFDDEPVPVFLDNNSSGFKRHGDLIVGDIVVDRLGNPTKVLATFPHKNIPMYKVTLTDGRSLRVGDEHLWTVYTSKQRSKFDDGHSVTPMVLSTQEMVDRGVVRTYDIDSREHLKFFIPMNGAVNWSEKKYGVDPYIVGAFIGNGCLKANVLSFSSNDIETVSKLTKLLFSDGFVKHKGSYTYYFLNNNAKFNAKYIQTKNIFGEMSEIYDKYSHEKRIPHNYMFGSIEQRWKLVQGLFDTDGTVSNDNRFRVTYSSSSESLVHDIQKVLYSLGISSTISKHSRKNKKRDEYILIAKASNEDKLKFFSLTRKLDIIKKWINKDSRERVKKFDLVGIKSIEPIGRADAQCILVDNPEHLYQAGDFIVTHNTEMTKQLAEILFDDTRNLHRFDMSEYSQEDSLERFRDNLTTKVWERPYSIILLDEIEKACGAVTRLLLQVLDDARLSDRNGRETSFHNAYIILTTNGGSEIYQNISMYQDDIKKNPDGTLDIMGTYDKLIRRSLTETQGENKFPPELLGRVDAIIPFQPLNDKTRELIVFTKLNKLKDEVMRKYGIELMIHKDVIKYIVYDNLDTDANSGGARAVISKLESEVTVKVAKIINEAKYIGLGNIYVEVDGEMSCDNKTYLESRARIKVSMLDLVVV